MSQYIRHHVPGGTYFISARLQDQSADLLTAQIGLLRDTVRVCRKQSPFDIDAAVILPAGLHMIWTLPAGDHDVSGRWRMIASTYSRHLKGPDDPVKAQKRTSENRIWERRFRHHAIRDRADFALHMHLIVTAPLRAGLVRQASDWPYASWHPSNGNPKLRTIAPVPSSPDPVTAAPAM